MHIDKKNILSGIRSFPVSKNYGKNKIPILHMRWNHFHSWGPMFVDCWQFASLLERYVVGKWFIAYQCKTVQYRLAV